MSYRSSPYIDFNSGTVLKAPMELLAERRRPWALDDMLDLFESRVDVWQLGPAVGMLKQIETQPNPSVWAHTAYALLAVVFTYFEMIGKTLNPSSQPSGTAGPDFSSGFCDVYPEFVSRMADVAGFRDRVRNGMYHLGYTKNNLLIHNAPQVTPADFFVDRGQAANPVYLVNPHQVTRTVVAHFPTFLQRLRNPEPQFNEFRTRFRSFFENYHA